MSTPIPSPTPPARNLQTVVGDPVYITQAQLAALFTTPKQVLPAFPGYMPRFTGGSIYREPGTAWTLNGGTNMVVRALGGGSPLLHTFDLSWLSTGPGGTLMLCSGPSFGTTGISTAMASGLYASKAYEIAILVANPTLGSGGLWFTPFYDLHRVAAPGIPPA
jgi:hypothetical protein